MAKQRKRSTGSARTTRRTAASTAVRLVTPTVTIDIRWPDPDTKEATALQQQAMQWTHVVRNRARWAGTASLAEQQDDNARSLLTSLGIDKDELKQIADAGSVQVAIPFTAEQNGWEVRILPWEFILSAATRELRQGSLVVTRSLLHDRKSRPAAYRKVLFVESAPGTLAQDWDFENERRLVTRYAKAAKFERLPSPTRAQLRAAVARLRPDIVHLAGFDTHQGLELVKDPRADKVFDGYLMAAGGSVEPVAASELASALTVGDFAPSLVFCNIWNSAARTAPMLVAAGVRSAIGFQDAIDDALAEVFLGSFYRALTRTRNIDAAFQAAWESMRAQPKSLRGSGIVLWHSGTLGARAVTSTRATSRPIEQQQVLSPTAVAAGKASEILVATVEPQSQFSYGLLHNDRDLFRRFLVRNLSDKRILGLDVFVELHSNEGTYPYRQTFNLDDPVLDLSRKVRIALTSNLARTLDEVLHTALYVQVKWGDHEIFRETFSVTLAPVDQWTDTDADRIFLPSFVFPRDSAVAAIVKNAEQFMTALRDDPTAGFDGYQAIDPELANPAQHVDSQVQGLWYSSVYKVPASYINPPPTYAVASQRIRTPCEIIAGGFGTCIDLALMLASCLEAIEIHPVIFVLDDHAFPGYWRTETARDGFRRRIAASASDPDAVVNAIQGDSTSAKKLPGVSWCFDRTVFAEIKKEIDRNRLVPLESVGLTGRWSLGEAVTEARTYFEKDEEKRFLLMIDIKTARERGVTPLPLGPRLK